MSLALSDYLLRDFVVDHVDPVLVELGTVGAIRFPAAIRSYVHIVLSGTVHVELENTGEAADLEAGDFALLLYGAPHALGNRCDADSSIFHFGECRHAEAPPVLMLGDAPAGPRVLSGCIEVPRKVRCAPVNRALPHLLCFAGRRDENRPPTIQFGDMAQIENACRGPGASAFVHTLFQLHLMQALRWVHEDMQQILPVHIGAPEMGLMAAVVRKIRAHPEKHWTVASLAEEMGCSRSSFAAKFQAYAGMGPIAFVTRTRLVQAAAMLKGNPELPLWEVAKRVGYDPQGSFTRAFKAHFGVAPRRYVEQLMREGQQ